MVSRGVVVNPQPLVSLSTYYSYHPLYLRSFLFTKPRIVGRDLVMETKLMEFTPDSEGGVGYRRLNCVRGRPLILPIRSILPGEQIYIIT